MNGMKGIDMNTLSVQIKSLMIYEFLNEYTRLEQMIRVVFEQNISALPAKIVQQLYFYNGGLIGTFIDCDEEAVKLNATKYKENDPFRDLKINQIIKIFQKNPCLEAFNFEIQSIQRAATAFSFYDCVIRLLNIRQSAARNTLT